MERRMSGQEAARGGGPAEPAFHAVPLSTLSPELLSPFFHEFRTSLTMIKTCIALLTNPSVSYDATELREFMDIVRRGGDRVDRLVRDFLAILKLESGVAEQEAREAEPTEDVAWAVEKVINSLKNEAAERGVTIQVKVPEDLPALPVLDEHLQMMVEKLVHNAIKFSKPEGGQVIVRATPEDGKIRFDISDQGIGIPQEEQLKIFDRFYQLTRAGLERQGAGLGLAVTRGLVELYGGRIFVESAVDIGSVFTFILPRTRTVGPAAPPPPPPPSPPPLAAEPTGEDVPLTAEEAFRRLGITFGEEEKPEDPPAEKEAGNSRGLFGGRKK
jgi:signal transduction histidine kinase